MLPEPAAVQVPPPAPAQVQVQVSEAGKVSATVGAGGVARAGVGGRDGVGHRAAGRGRGHAVGLGDREIGAAPPACRCRSRELLPGVGSVTPAGAVTVAVLLSVPVAAAEIVQLAV